MSTAAPLAPEDTQARNDQRCAVCEHPLADHDSIGNRFCQATQARALSRGCICATSG